MRLIIQDKDGIDLVMLDTEHKDDLRQKAGQLIYLSTASADQEEYHAYSGLTRMEARTLRDALTVALGE